MDRDAEACGFDFRKLHAGQGEEKSYIRAPLNLSRHTLPPLPILDNDGSTTTSPDLHPPTRIIHKPIPSLLPLNRLVAEIRHLPRRAHIPVSPPPPHRSLCPNPTSPITLAITIITNSNNNVPTVPITTTTPPTVRKAPRENNIDFLETPPPGLGVPEVDDWQEGGVEEGEEEVGAPVDVVDEDGRDHHDQEVEEPVAAGGEGVGFRARFEGVDFGGVELLLGGFGVS